MTCCFTGLVPDPMHQYVAGYIFLGLLVVFIILNIAFILYDNMSNQKKIGAKVRTLDKIDNSACCVKLRSLYLNSREKLTDRVKGSKYKEQDLKKKWKSYMHPNFLNLLVKANEDDIISNYQNSEQMGISKEDQETPQEIELLHNGKSSGDFTNIMKDKAKTALSASLSEISEKANESSVENIDGPDGSRSKMEFSLISNQSAGELRSLPLTHSKHSKKPSETHDSKEETLDPNKLSIYAGDQTTINNLMNIVDESEVNSEMNKTGQSDY